MDYTDNKRVEIDENGKMFIDGVAVKVKEVVFEDKKSMTAAYRDLKNSFDVGAIGADQFYSELEAMRDIYLEEGSAAWWNYTKKILAYEKELADEQWQAEQKLIDQKINRLSSMYALGMISAKQYYDELELVRDEHFESGSQKWNEFNQNLASFYMSQLETAEKSAESLTERLAGGLMQLVTVKDREGNITDRFYRLTPPDPEKAKKFFEGYTYLENNGAPGFLLDSYLSMSPDKSAALIESLSNLGTNLPSYLSQISNAREQITVMAEQFYGADVIADAVAKIIDSLQASGIASGIEINQSFYGQNLTPAEVAQETVAALRLQGVGI